MVQLPAVRAPELPGPEGARLGTAPGRPQHRRHSAAGRLWSEPGDSAAQPGEGRLWGGGEVLPQPPALFKPAQAPKFDRLRLREWFNAMDVERTGRIKKMVFLDFVRNNPTLRGVLLLILRGRGEDKGSEEASPTESRISTTESSGLHIPSKDRNRSKDRNSSNFSSNFSSNVSSERTTERTNSVMSNLAAEPAGGKLSHIETARQYRRLLALFRELDTDNSGTLEWEEFVEYFKLNGVLIEYKTSENPKTRLCELLGTMHTDPEAMDEDEMAEFSALKEQHLGGPRRASLGTFEAEMALQAVAAAEEAAARLSAPDAVASAARRRNSLATLATGSLVPHAAQAAVQAGVWSARTTTRSGTASSGGARTTTRSGTASSGGGTGGMQVPLSARG